MYGALLLPHHGRTVLHAPRAGPALVLVAEKDRTGQDRKRSKLESESDEEEGNRFEKNAIVIHMRSVLSSPTATDERLPLPGLEPVGCSYFVCG